MAESLWMTFAFADTQPQGWLVHKLGKWIDPLQVVVNGSQTMHAVDTGFQYCPVANETCQIKVESLDAPIVSPTVNYYPTGSFNIHPPAPQQGWAFNLFNNAWATNYPIFSLNPNNRFRFKVVLHG